MNKIRFYILAIVFIISTRSIYSIPADTSKITSYISKASKFRNTHPDSMFIFLNKALQLVQKASSEKQQSIIFQKLSEYYQMKEDYGKATQNLLNALIIEESMNNKGRIAELYNDLGMIYSIMEKFSKSMAYFDKSLKLFSEIKDSANIARLYCRIGRQHGMREYCETRTVEQKRVDYTTAIMYLKKGEEIFARHHDDAGKVVAYLNLASVYNRFNRSNDALPLVYASLNYYKKTGNIDGIGNTLYSLAITYRKLKQFDKAIEFFKETIRYSKENFMSEGIQFVYEELSQAYYESGNYKKSRDYYVQYMITRDSIYNLEKSNQIFELDAKYQSEKKENQILALTLEKNKKQQYVYLLISVLIILSLTSVYLIRNAKSKATIAEQNSRIHEQKIKELEKERQLVAAHAVLHGEEAERSRLARDLHDGLGGLLSGLKLSLTSIKGNFVFEEKSVNQFNRALDLLDTSIKELRRVAHNMMPEVLTKFGLKEALSEFCIGLNNSAIDIKFRFYGEEKRLNQNLEINIYRIVQELINNALKHSGASEIILMVVQDELRIHLTVQDNGNGFNISEIENNSGHGIGNIRSRTESLNGTLEIDSKPDSGTEISVEFSLV